ncbi:MAG: hypothetical protein PHX27_03475 [Candidatus ainarchaeum sp.]|nr:hypothetical protein [Candidatus ainarchaeum sp.]
MKKITKQIKRRLRSGENLVNAIYTISSKRLKRKINPPKNGQYDEVYFKNLKKRIYPKGYKKRSKPRPTLMQLLRRRLAEKTFKQKNVGLIVVKPEIMPFTSDVRKFLRKIGCNIVLSKVHIFTPTQLESIYFTEMRKWQDFPINAGILTSAPSRILIFKHAPRERYIELLKKTNHIKYEQKKANLQTMPIQELFHLAVKGVMDEGRPETLRGEVTHKRLPELGFDKMVGISKKLDPTGYLEYRVKQGKSVYNILTGIHAPETQQELIEHGATLLNRNELTTILKHT